MPSSTGRSSTSQALSRWPGSCCTCVYGTPEGGLYYLDVWEDEDSCTRAFEERLHPAVDRAFGGRRPSGEPVVHPLDVLDARGPGIESADRRR